MKKVFKFWIMGLCFWGFLYSRTIENIYAENTEDYKSAEDYKNVKDYTRTEDYKNAEDYNRTEISAGTKSKWEQLDLLPLLPEFKLNLQEQDGEKAGSKDKLGTETLVLKVEIVGICILSALEIVLVMDCMGSCFFTYRKRKNHNTRERKIPYSFAEQLEQIEGKEQIEQLEPIEELEKLEETEKLEEILDRPITAENKTSNIVSINKGRMRSKKRSEMPPIVVQAKHICMDFDKEVNEYSSMKELMIQTIKGKRKKEKYRALDNISFTIRKGEVIGVIGTNGAGKSTLLKIIAKALIPTSGNITVNRDKIQILTLGTGFDMELTGRENVYLNGAIIGYEKKFIDEHYDQIVKFAELEDFMEEKVKNYSSGMVSRLGFAIATVGDAAEILLLDEVLSVGDKVFQAKSMKRIKEMIHGGSTVIMVSHSIRTIKENCDKVFWIEKGHMIISGDAKFICNAYEKYDGNVEKLTFSESKKNRRERVKDWLNLKIAGRG